MESDGDDNKPRRKRRRMRAMKNKILSQAGESIGETLVALLIAALALVMLAGAMSSSSGVILKSRDKLDDYYTANEEDNGVIKMTSGGSTAEKRITITDTTGNISLQSYKVSYYKNDEFGKKTVVAYKLSE